MFFQSIAISHAEKPTKAEPAARTSAKLCMLFNAMAGFFNHIDMPNMPAR